MKYLIAIPLFLMAGCATVNQQPANVFMGVLAAAATYQQYGCIPAIVTADPVVACAPTTATDQKTIDASVQACLTATVTQLVMANVKVPKCQTAPVVSTSTPVLTTNPTTVSTVVLSPIPVPPVK